jgi:hypothetical protein
MSAPPLSNFPATQFDNCHPPLARTPDTPTQATLPWRERVAHVDDVMPTGATLFAPALALRRAGAVGVATWVIARTLPPSHPA